MYYVSVHTIQNNNLAACCFCAPRVQFARVPGAVGTTGTHLRSDTLGLCAAIK